jgi:hypothetical protein
MLCFLGSLFFSHQKEYPTHRYRSQAFPSLVPHLALDLLSDFAVYPTI